MAERLEEEAQPAVRPAPARTVAHRLTRLLPPLLLAGALVGEVLTLLVMTVVRYHSQGLEPVFFDLGKTANVMGLLFEVPFIALFAALLLLRRHHRLTVAAIAATASYAGLVVLVSAPPMVLEGAEPSYTLYLVFLAIKVAELCVCAAVVRRPNAHPVRTAVRALGTATVLVVAVLSMVITTVLISPFGSSITDQPRQEYDAGVILGAAVWSGDRPSPVLRERINKGFDLLKSGTVQFLVLTGGHAPNEMAEADVARRELLQRGADPTRIVTETRTSSTLEQVVYIRDQLQKKQRWQSFVIISDQFHLMRALEICRFNEIDALGVSSESPLGPQNLAVYHLRESGALILYWLFGV